MDVYIESVRLVGCQGYRDVTLNLSRGLNIIKADNNSVGKSIFFKMLREAATPGYWGREGCKQLIRWGRSFAEMTFNFSDNTEAIFRLYPTYRQYIFKDKSNGVESLSETPPRELLERLSIIASDQYIANVLTTQGDLLFVESSSATDRALLTLLTSHSGMETLVERTKVAVNDATEKMARLSTLQSYVQAEFQTLSQVDTADLLYKQKALDIFIPTLEVLEMFVDVATLDCDVKRMSTYHDAIASLAAAVRALAVIEEIADASQGIAIREKLPPLTECLRILAALQDLPTDSPRCENIDILRAAIQEAGKVYDYLDEMCSQSVQLKQLYARSAEIKDFLTNNVQRCHCPFYDREVFFDEKGCIPSGDGFA